MSDLSAFAESVWIVEGPSVRDMGVMFTTRMTVVRLCDGSLWVDSPVSLSSETLKRITDLGPVKYLIAATPRHVWRLSVWHRLFPEAQLWAPRPTPFTLKKDSLPFVGILSDEPLEVWKNDFDQLAFKGNPLIEEILFFHIPSRTVILDDLIQVHPIIEDRPFRNGLIRLGGVAYVPVAALFDGKQYVVENYNTVTITPVSIPHLMEKPDFNNLNAAAMGISRQYEGALPALPAVAGELAGIVKDAQAIDARGVLPGTILLNGAFTEKSMETLLGSPHTVVHIASHFVFEPGDDDQSYLLLAGKDQDTSGYHMTVADFRDDQKLSLDETDLLTLSACETGMSGSSSNGREVDGLGTTAQLKGAKAVISSLWSVNDASTGELMADFYRQWVGGQGKVSKVEALREAQLNLMQRKLTPQSSASGRGFGVAQNDSDGQDAPAGYAHPYYWAPFVLMGNWK